MTISSKAARSESACDDLLVEVGRQWGEAYRNWEASDGDGTELVKIFSKLQDKAAKIPAFSIEGILVKLRITGTHYHLMERHGEDWDNIYAKLTWQAWDDLERLTGEASKSA